MATVTLGDSNFAINNLCERNYSFTHTGLTVGSTEMALHMEEERKSQPLNKHLTCQHYYVYTIKFLTLMFLTYPEGHALGSPSQSSRDI